jgi:hypothetical protein
LTVSTKTPEREGLHEMNHVAKIRKNIMRIRLSEFSGHCFAQHF